MENKKISFSFFIALFIGIALLTFFVFLPFLPVLVLAAIFSVVFRPIYKTILKISRGQETVAALGVILLILLLIILPVIFFGGRIFEESKNVYVELSAQGVTTFTSILTPLETKIQHIFPTFSFNTPQYIEQAAIWLSDHVGQLVIGTVHFLLNVLLFIISLFFFFKHGKKYVRAIVGLSPLDDAYDAEILSSIETTINSVIRGTLFIAMIQGFLVGVGFVLFGIQNAVLWGALAALSALIPGVGTAIVVVPAVLYLFAIGSVPSAIGLSIWGVVVVGLIDNVLIPFFYGKGIEIDSLFVLFSVLGGLIFFGPLGFIFGPIVLSLFIVLIRIYITLVAPPQKPLLLPEGRGEEV